MSFAPPPLPRSPLEPVSFSGDRSEFRRLVMRGAFLELVTVGFYRFWLTTDIRRLLWSNTHIDGDAAEYTGTGVELLLGFLFALAILAPIYLAYFFIGLEVERFKAFASTPLFLFFYLFGQFAIYRARRYRLTRTVWRGVRFWMSGSGWIYAMKSALWGVLVIFTLGFALPWREAALERYKMKHSYYGDLEGCFEGRGWEFFKRGWWIWLIGIAVILGLPILSVVAKYHPGLSPLVLIFSLFAALVYLLTPFLYAEFKAIEWRWWLSGIRFGSVSLESDLGSGKLVGLYWKVIGWFLLLAPIFFVYMATIGSVFARKNGLPLDQFLKSPLLLKNTMLFVLVGVGYLAYLLSMTVVMRVYLLRDVWARVVASVTVHNIEAAADVAAEGEMANALGEGFADGLDVAGF